MASAFVHRPAAILAVALGLFLLDRLDRGRAAGPRARPALRWPALLWALFALWEALVMGLTPEADIRVDLLLIWPPLAVVSGLSLVTALLLRPRRG
ncbi:MAG: hypothetical protein VKI81_09320 [Synechococcaceae cyanobacterium]|nr:hypothetical protein [Synechococcaceae cyanobacterium]